MGAVEQAISCPNAKLDQVFSFIRDKVDIDIVSGLNARDLQGMSSEGDLAIPICGASIAQTKDILGGGKGFGYSEGTEERAVFVVCLFKTHSRNFSGGGMDLVVIVAMDFFAQDRTCVAQGGNVLQRTGADKPILQPTIRAFNLALGLRGEGINHIGVHQS